MNLFASAVLVISSMVSTSLAGSSFASAIDSRPNPLAFVAWFGCLCGIYVFGQGIFLLQRKRRGGKGTACAIGAARAGSLQVGGSVQGVPPLKAPVSGKPCFYYRATVWRQDDPDLEDSWVSVAEETMSKPFVLRDTTGSILVEPRGAVVTLPHDSYEEYGKTLLATHTDVPVALEEFLERHKVDASAALRVEECLIAAGAEVYVTGLSAVNPRAALAEIAKALSVRKVAERRVEPVVPQVIRLSSAAGSGQGVPAGSMTMQSRVAAALTLAREQASESAAIAVPSIAVAVEAPGIRSETPKELVVEQEPAPTAFVLGQPQDGAPFTISHRDQPVAEAPSSVRAFAFLLVGPVVTVASVYFLLMNFGWV